MEVIKAHPDRIEKICYAGDEKGSLGKLLDEGKKGGIKLFMEKRIRINELAGYTRHQGVVAFLDDFCYSNLDDLIHVWKNSDEKAFILILDSIQDPHNLGAIIRSAECAGAHGVIIPRDRAAGVTASVEKASAGAAAHMPVARVTNIAVTLDELKSEGLWIVGAEEERGKSLYDADLDIDLAIVIGSEGKGIRPLVRKKCDFLVSIPMRGEINSLNASVSAAIIMYEVVRRRYSKAK